MTERDSQPTPGRRRYAEAAGRTFSRGARSTARRLDAMFSARGPGFRTLAIGHVAGVAGDALVTLGLAGTLFFQVPSTEARENVALYLLVTIAPFAVLGPLMTRLFPRSSTAYRAGLVVGSGGRVVVAILMLIVGLRTLWLYPLAFALLVFSRIHQISRSSLVPVVVDRPVDLVSANARLARLGIVAGGLAVPIGGPLVAWLGGWPALVLAAIVFTWATYAGVVLPIQRVPLPPDRDKPAKPRIPQAIRLARSATGGVRFLNGFLVSLVAFEFRDADAAIADFGALLGAAGAGYFIAALVSPALERRLREEPMVVASLAIEAGAAFIAAQWFGLAAAASLAAAAGFAWGTAKFGFDGLLQSTLPPHARGAAFVSAETLFQIVWVVGAIIPVGITVPITPGLIAAGCLALIAQVVYISGLLVPLAAQRRRDAESMTGRRR